MALLTREEGLQFVQTILNIPLSDVPVLPDESVPLNTKLSFLETLLRSFQEKEPFQSIYLMSHDISQRRRPTWEEVKRDLMLGRGGLCYWQNVFMYALLSSLGLDAYITFSTVDVGTGSSNNHVIVLIRELTPGSLHLVDVGVGLYIPRAVPLDFQLESAEFQDSFTTYKIVREPNGIMNFMKKDSQAGPEQNLSTSNDDQTRSSERHMSNNNQQTTKIEKDQKGIIENDRDEVTDCRPSTLGQTSVVTANRDSGQQSTWHKFYFFNPSVLLKDLEPLYPDFDVHFSDPTRLSTHSSPRAMCWRNGRFIALVNLKMIEEVEVGKLKKTTIVESLETRLNFKKIPKKSNQPVEFAQDEPHLQTNDHLITKVDIEEKVKQEQNDIQAQDTVQKQNNFQPELADLIPLIQAYEKHFPQLPREMVESAMKNWLATGTLFPVPQHFV